MQHRVLIFFNPFLISIFCAQLCVQNSPQEARNMLLQNPQLAYALLQAQVVMRIVDPEIALVRDADESGNTENYKKVYLPPSFDLKGSMDLKWYTVKAFFLCFICRKCFTVKLQSSHWFLVDREVEPHLLMLLLLRLTCRQLSHSQEWVKLYLFPKMQSQYYDPSPVVPLTVYRTYCAFDCEFSSNMCCVVN